MTNALPEYSRWTAEHQRLRGPHQRRPIAAAAGRPVYPPDNGGRLRSHPQRLRDRAAHAPAADPRRRRRPAHRGDRSATCKHMMDNPRHRRRPQRHACSTGATSAWASSSRSWSIEGKQPRVMLDYSGTLLYGLRQMGPATCSTRCARITCDPRYRGAVEWLGTALGPCGRALDAGAGLSAARARLAAPLRRPLRHRGAAAGCAASRRREMALPNHPDVAYEFVAYAATNAAISGCWCRSTPSSARTAAGREHKHLPHRLVCAQLARRDCRDHRDHQDAGQRHEAGRADAAATTRPRRSLPRERSPGESVPPLVTQIADGENGGVMMNEFPPKYMRRDAGMLRIGRAGDERDGIPGALFAPRRRGERPAGDPADPSEADLGPLQPGDGARGLEAVIAELRKEDSRFNMEGGSWTNNISWVRGYERAGSDGGGQLAVRREGAETGPSDQRAALSQRPVPLAVLPDQLLSLLGAGGIRGLRDRDLPPRQGGPRPRLLTTPVYCR